jgi:peptidoglycan hydrolase-like protein with peptidoglycan-binding domain
MNRMINTIRRGAVIVTIAGLAALGLGQTVGAATAAPTTPAVAAEAACDAYTLVAVSGHPGWYLHVPSLGNRGNYNCVVVRGHRGLPVLVVQESLVVCFGLSVGPNGPDGDFGGNTERAVKQVQSWNNLSVDGRFGKNTSAAFWFQAYDHNNGGAHTGLCYRR